MALCCHPKILFGRRTDDRTDVTMQAQILDLMNDLKKTTGTAIVLVTHDLGVVAQMADRISVMYAGKIVESGTRRPDLLQSAPSLHLGIAGVDASVAQSTNNAKSELMSIPGSPPDLFAPPKGCAFAARCPYAMTACQKVDAETFTADDGHMVRCWLMDSRAPAVTPPVGRAAVRGKEEKA